MIGVRLSDVTAENMKTLKLSKAEGAVVESVNPNSPAATAGLREKDVIIQFDGERVRSASHLSRLVAETPAGREVMFSVMRDGKQNGSPNHACGVRKRMVRSPLRRRDRFGRDPRASGERDA